MVSQFNSLSIFPIHQFYCLSNAVHGQIINLPVISVCVCLSVCVCVHRIFCQLAYRSDPSTDFTVDSLKDADLRKDVPFGGLDDE